MKSVREWILSQLVSKYVISSTPSSGSEHFFNEENEGSLDEDFDEAPGPSHASHTSEDQGNQHVLLPQQVSGECSFQSKDSSNSKETDPLVKIEDLRVMFLRLVQRLGQTPNNLLVAKVLHRIHLATLIRAEESDLKRVSLGSDRARVRAAEQEASGLPELNLSFRILVLGKTGVGKSATINSIFGQTRTVTDAFRPGTVRIQEVVGTVKGVKISIIDTPGLLQPTARNMRRNKRILISVKRYIRKSPPDIVLYFERLDLVNTSGSDFLHAKLISDVFGTAIWFNTILVMTHSSSALPEGPDGYPVTYDSYVNRCSDLAQQLIHQAVFDTRLENPIVLVENHPQCKRNAMGEKVLPNGQDWKSHLLLLCSCTKVLGDVNALLKFENSIDLGPLTSNRLPSLPHLLSSLLRRHVPNPTGMDYEIEKILLSEIDEEDEYDKLPSIRILTKSQFEKLTDVQKKEYLDELDYREILYLRKQLKEEFRRQRKKKLSSEVNLVNDNSDDQQASPEAILLPDMTVPPSFDSDCPVHRYRCLVTGDQWLARPVHDPQGWDHDVGFDGVNLETAIEIKRNLFASVKGQLNKDKHDLSILSECAACYSDPRGTSYTVGLDVQSSGKDLMYTVRSDTVLGSLRHNIAECGVSLMSFRRKYYVAAKLGDTIVVGRKLKFIVNAGRMGGNGQVAHGGSFEAVLRGGDYPVRNDNISLAITFLSLDKDMVIGGNLQSEFQLGRSSKISVNANLNNRRMGQLSVKASSSEHLQISLIAAFTIFRALRRKRGESAI